VLGYEERVPVHLELVQDAIELLDHVGNAAARDQAGKSLWPVVDIRRRRRLQVEVARRAGPHQNVLGAAGRTDHMNRYVGIGLDRPVLTSIFTRHPFLVLALETRLICVAVDVLLCGARGKKPC
jgi:hypothetical protein